MQIFKSIPFIFFLGFFIWSIPMPEGFTENSWKMLSIFLATIYGIVTAPKPMGVIALIAIVVLVLTDTLTISEALSGYSESVLWLVMFAFFISRGFNSTKLGRRIAYLLISKIGNKTLGLSYGFVLTDFLLSPFMPSATARGGGMLYPIANALIGEIRSKSTIRQDFGFNTGKFIVMVCYQSVVITSCMFLTSMAANPIVQKIAMGYGIQVTWFSWALGAIVPGILTLILMPIVLYYISPPDIKDMHDIQVVVRQNLKNLGPVTREEKIMLGTFGFLLFSWIVLADIHLFGMHIKISTVTTALLGVIILLLTRVLSWDNIIEEKGAWKTFFWFGALLMMSDQLVKMGIISNIGEYIESYLKTLGSYNAFVLSLLAYFYCHYFFASATAKISVLYGVFLSVLLTLGFSPELAAMILAYFSIMSACLTHFGLTPGPIFFSAGFYSIRDWWYIGLVMSVVYITIWSVIGSLWWKAIGWW